MFENIALTLSGSIVVLEPLRAEHGPGLHAAARDMDWSFMHVDPVASDELFDRWLDDALERGASGEHVPFAVLAAGTRRPLGSTRYLSLRPEHRGLEIGWTWLTRPAWSSGANVEAKLLLLEHAFERLGCMRVEFKTDAKNERSRRALEALPAQFEGVFRKHMLVGNDGRRLRDSAWYSIVDDEWPAVKANLVQRLEPVSDTVS